MPDSLQAGDRFGTADLTAQNKVSDGESLSVAVRSAPTAMRISPMTTSAAAGHLP